MNKIIMFTLLGIFLNACSSGGSDSGPDTLPPIISVTSHADNEVITGGRTITLTGKVSSDVSSFSVSQNGSQISNSFNQNSFRLNVQLVDRENLIELVASDAAGNSTSQTLTLNYPFLSLTNGHSASMVIGQADFNSTDVNRGGNPSANSLNLPIGSVVVFNEDALLIPDCVNHRILGFNEIPSALDINADFVLGQDDFETNTQGISSTKISCPISPRIHNDRLFFVDSGNNRILIWNTVPSSNSIPANQVLGHSNFDTPNGGCDAQSLSEPSDVFVVDDKIIVADSNNHRVLIWESMPVVNGQAADLVLGQQNFDSCESNRGGIVDGGTLNFPVGVWSDGTKLIVVDTLNHRALIWNTFPTQNGESAQVVLGQDTMFTNNNGRCQNCFSSPLYVHSNGNQLFVAEDTNKRVLIWDSIPSVNNALADGVIGQPDFTSSISVAGEDVLLSAGGVYGNQDRLFVTDYKANRIMLFEALNGCEGQNGCECCEGQVFQ